MRTLIEMIKNFFSSNKSQNPDWQALQEQLDEIRNRSPQEVDPTDEPLQTWRMRSKTEKDRYGQQVGRPGPCSYLLGVAVPRTSDDFRKMIEASSDGTIVLATRLDECTQMCKPFQDCGLDEYTHRYAHIAKHVENHDIGQVIFIRVVSWQLLGDELVLIGRVQDEKIHGPNVEHRIEICASLEDGKGIAHIWA